MPRKSLMVLYSKSQSVEPLLIAKSGNSINFLNKTESQNEVR